MSPRKLRSASRWLIGAWAALASAGCTVASVTFEPLADAAIDLDAAGAPETTLVTTPTDPSARAQAEFTFTSGSADATFECRLDGAPFTACGSPATIEVADGAHAFSVRARDALGTDATPATFAWVVDTVAPQVALRAAPTDPTMALRADFVLDVVGAAAVTCQLDDGAAAPCAADGHPSYEGLAIGPHAFTVRATDAAGNASTATHAWNVVSCAPTTIEAEALMMQGGWGVATGAVLQGGHGAGVAVPPTAALTFQFVGRGFTAFVREGPAAAAYVLGIDGQTGRFDLSGPTYRYQVPIAISAAGLGVHQGTIMCLNSTCLIDYLTTRCD